MGKEERIALLTRAIRTYGEPAQIDMAIEEVEEAKLERLKNRLDGRNNWRDSSLHKWIERQFSAGGDGHE